MTKPGTLPRKKPEDQLEAELVNIHTRAAEIIGGSPMMAGGMNGHHSGLGTTMMPGLEYLPEVLEIVSLRFDANNDNDVEYGVYEASPRYYNNATKLWKTDKSQGPFRVDNNALTGTDENKPSAFVVGEFISAFWHEQRNAYIPISESISGLVRFTLIENMGASTTDQAESNLLELDGTDKNQTATILDPSAIWTKAINTAQGIALIVNGSYYAVGTQFPKPLVRFTLDETLGTSDAAKNATITNQYSPGMDNPGNTISVQNLLTSVGGTYVFEGDSGDAGLAFWDSGQTYIIIQMECP